jgi:hypothetical protein
LYIAIQLKQFKQEKKMEIIANSIEEAVDYLNDNSGEDLIDYQLDGNVVNEINEDEELSVEWSWTEEKHSMSGKTLFNFYC